MKKALLVISVASTMTSCQAMLQGALGIKEPTAQSDATVRNYAAQYYPEYTIYRVDSTQMPTLLRQAYKPKWEPGFRPLQFACFAPDGTAVTQWASCEGDLQHTLSTFPPTSHYPADSSKTFRDFAKGTRPIRNTDQPLVPKKEGYTYLVYWTTWTDKQSIKLVERLNTYVRQHGGKKSDIVLVNIDNYATSGP